MSSQPLDVLMRVRLRYEAEDAARRALGDLTQIHSKASSLGGVAVGARLGNDLRGVATHAETAQRGLTDLRQAADRLGTSRGVNELERDLQGAVRHAGALESRIETLTRRMETLGRQRHAMEGRGGAFGNEFLASAGMGGALRFGMSRAAVGGVLAGGAVAGIGAGMAAASREAITFESAMAEVKKAVNDLTPEAFERMERTILRTSRVTGIAKEEMAKLVAQAGFAGRPTEELARFAEFGAKAAGAFGMTAEDTGDKLAKLGNVYKLNQRGIEDLADGINLLGDNTASKERQIVDFLYRTGATGQALKFTALQTAAIGAAAISTGKEAEVAATGFNAFAMKLGTADRQGEEFQKGLRALGLTGRRVKAEIAADPIEGFLDVLERLNKLPDSKKLDVASRIGGLEYGDDLLAYAGAIDGIRKALGLMRDEAARAGSVEKTFKIFDATTQRSIDRAGASMEAFATKVGQRFTPAIAEAARYVERLFGGMTKAIERGERAEALAGKLASGKALTKDEQAEIDANPRLKGQVENRRRVLQEEAEERAREKRFEAIPGAREDGAAQDRQRREGLERLRRPGEDGPGDPEAWRPGGTGLPGTGRRSDLSDAARVSLAAYHETVEHGLERTERVVREAGRRMREDLTIKARIDLGPDRLGEGARIETASLGGTGGLGGGLGVGAGRFGGGGFGGGSGRGAAAGGFRSSGGGGGGHGAGGSGLTGPHVGTPGAGAAGPNLSGDAKERAMQYYAGLRAGGLDAVHANALMGHATQETGGTFKGDSWNAREGAGGMLQYRGNRLANLKAFAATQGKAWTDPYVQGQFASAEQRMDPYEAKRARPFMAATDLDTATREAGRNVVRFGDNTGPYRARMARAFMDGSAYEDLGRGAASAAVAGGPSTASGSVRANLMRGQYGAPGQNLVQITTPGGKSAWVHKEAAPSFQAFVNDLEGSGYNIKSFGGHAHREKRGGHGLSQHAYGNAIDINPATNPFRTDITDMPIEQTRAMARKYGLIWGKDWRPGSKDPMHFEWNGTRPWLDQGGAAARAGGGIDMPAGWRRRLGADDAAAMSPRFTDPAKMQPRARPLAEPGGSAGIGARGGGGASVTQHFHGGFDEQVVARRAKLEQNREIRRSQARALHGIGRLA